MRYTIEAKSKKLEGIVEDLMRKESALKLVDKYDPFEKLGGNVQAMGDAMRKFKSSGISWDVLNYYLRGKGISQKVIEAVLGDVQSFFKKVGLMDKSK